MILPFSALSILQDLPRSRLSYIDIGHAFIVQRLNSHRSHKEPFRKRSSARDGSQPRSTILEEEIEVPRPGGQALPKIVASARRRDLIEAAFAKLLGLLISYNQKLDPKNDRSYLLRAPREAPDGQRNRNLGAARQENGVD